LRFWLYTCFSAFVAVWFKIKGNCEKIMISDYNKVIQNIDIGVDSKEG